MKRVSSIGKMAALFVLFSSIVFAGDGVQENLNIVWLGIASAMVMFMQVGFIALESGFTRAKNSVNVAAKGILDFSIGSLLFFMFGFGLMFGNGSLIGTTNFFLRDTIAAGDSGGIMFWVFQVMFVGAAATIVSGAVAERIKLTGYVIASALIAGLIYPIFGHWAWSSEGWLALMNFHDFAGSTVIHSLGGWLALTGAIVVGPRFEKFGKNGEIRAIPGHNIPLATLGTFILWFGWYGFNGGSTLLGDGSIAIVMLNTTLAGAAGAVSAMLFSLYRSKLVDLGMTLNGALAGLVGVTAGADVLSPESAIIVGLIAGVLVSISVSLIDKARIDDPVGAISVHGVNGAWGTLAVGIFCSEYSFLTQLTGMLTMLAYALGTGFLMFYIIDKLLGLRVDAQDEINGLDIAEHGYSAYPEFQSHSELSLFN